MSTASLILAASVSAATPTSPVEDLMVEFTRALCLAEQVELAAAERLVPAGWINTEREVERGRTYGTDAPLPIHDRYSLEWRGRVDGATMWLRLSLSEVSSASELSRSALALSAAADRHCAAA